MKEFSSFTNRRVYSTWHESPLDKMLMAISDNDWKHVRNTITPLFGNCKLKKTEVQANKCCEQLISNFSSKVDLQEVIDIKTFMAAYSMDLIANAVFGQPLDSLKDPENLFIKHANAVLNVENTRPLRHLGAVAPNLMRIIKWCLRLRYLPKDTLNYFTGILDDAKILADDPDKPDVLKMLVNAHKLDEESEEDFAASKRKSESSDMDQSPLSKALEDNEVLAQALAFFFTAHSPVTDCLTFTLYLLALHPDVQEKVVDEITIMLVSQPKVDYDSLSELNYLQKVISESLRLYSPVLRIERVCNKEAVINGLHIPKKTNIGIPIQAIHMDPTGWPDPEKFDPNRFNEEEKAKRDPYYWQPFGMGPRCCIGIRLAMMQVKMALVYILRNYKVLKCEETIVPVIRDKNSGSPIDVFLKFEARD